MDENKGFGMVSRAGLEVGSCTDTQQFQHFTNGQAAQKRKKRTPIDTPSDTWGGSWLDTQSGQIWNARDGVIKQLGKRSLGMASLEVRTRSWLFPHNVPTVENGWFEIPQERHDAAKWLFDQMNTGDGSPRAGVHESYWLADMVHFAAVQVHKYTFQAIPLEWCKRMLGDRGRTASESHHHRELKWNALAMLLADGMSDAEMEVHTPYGRRCDVAAPSSGVIVECGSTSVPNLISALMCPYVQTFALIQFPKDRTRFHDMYVFRRDWAWGEVEPWLTGEAQGPKYPKEHQLAMNAFGPWNATTTPTPEAAA